MNPSGGNGVFILYLVVEIGITKWAIWYGLFNPRHGQDAPAEAYTPSKKRLRDSSTSLLRTKNIIEKSKIFGFLLSHD